MTTKTIGEIFNFAKEKGEQKMANKILLRRGRKADLPELSVGEPAFTTDTRELFIGSDDGNTAISPNENAIYVKCGGEDDTAALRAAINSAPEGSVVYPVGECVLTNTGLDEGASVIVIKDGVTLDGRYSKRILFKYITVLERWSDYNEDTGWEGSVPTPHKIFRLSEKSAMKNVYFSEDTSSMKTPFDEVYPIIIYAKGGSITHCTFADIVSTGVCRDEDIGVGNEETFIGNDDTIFEYNTIKNAKILATGMDITFFDVVPMYCYFENISTDSSVYDEIFQKDVINCRFNHCRIGGFGNFIGNYVYNKSIVYIRHSENNRFDTCYIHCLCDQSKFIGNAFLNPKTLDLTGIENVIVNNVTDADSLGEFDSSCTVEGNITGI